jgi:adenosylcobinamide-GDP ribazoletransferase
MKRFLAALGFLTTIPGPTRAAQGIEELGKAAVWFPLVGALIGGLTALIQIGLSRIFPYQISAILSVGAWVFLTGGLHLDGLADSFDGLLNSSTSERRLEIMKDPRLGTFGAVGLILTIAIKISALSALPVNSSWLVLPLAASTARWLILWSAYQPAARPGGIGAVFKEGIKAPDIFIAAIVPLILTILCGWRGLVALLVGGACALGIFRLARIRLGGVTGDILGFMVETVEAAILLVFAAHVQ